MSVLAKHKLDFSFHVFIVYCFTLLMVDTTPRLEIRIDEVVST